MSAQWFIARQGKKYGPYPFEQLQEWARSGMLLPTEMVLGSSAKWQSASSVAGLFELPVAAVAVPEDADGTKKMQHALIAGLAIGGFVALLICGGVLALVNSRTKPTDQVVVVDQSPANKGTRPKDSKGSPGTAPKGLPKDTPKEGPKDTPKSGPKDSPKEGPKDGPKDLPRLAPPQEQRGNEASIQDFLRSEKARFDALYGFDKLDYTRGPKGERLEERLEEPGKGQGFIQQQGFVNAEGKFVAHGRRSQWFAKPLTDDRKVTEAWNYNAKSHGVILWRYDKTFLVKAFFVHVEGVQNGPYLSWDDKGSLRHVQFFKDGLRHGEFVWYIPGEGKVTFNFDNGKLVYNRRERTKRDFLALLRYAATSYSDPPGFIGRYRRDVFFEWIGEPDRKIGEGLSDQFPDRLWSGRYWYRCSDGTLSFKVNIAPPQNLVVLEQDD